MKFAKARLAVFAFLFLVISANRGAAEVTQKISELKVTDSVKYLLYLPDGYGDKDKKWPLIMYLHGAGERGDNLDAIKCNGLPDMVSFMKKHKFILVAPQCPKNEWWNNKLGTLIGLLDEIESNYDVDKDKVYVTGISMGGFGSWSLASFYPQRFAAVVPICGGGDKLFIRVQRMFPSGPFTVQRITRSLSNDRQKWSMP